MTNTLQERREHQRELAREHSRLIDASEGWERYRALLFGDMAQTLMESIVQVNIGGRRAA